MKSLILIGGKEFGKSCLAFGKFFFFVSPNLVQHIQVGWISVLDVVGGELIRAAYNVCHLGGFAVVYADHADWAGITRCTLRLFHLRGSTRLVLHGIRVVR